MCGIAAIIALAGNDVPPALCGRFDAALAHRGPDASGLATFRRDGTPCAGDAAEVALIHRRLSIIDLDPRANQPMASADGRYVLVFNGEIYNFVELREALARDGHVFRTTSDSEVLDRGLCDLGREGARPLHRHVRLRPARPRTPRIVPRARSLRHQAAVLRARQRPSRLRLRDRPAARRARRRARHRSGPHLPVPLGRPDRRRRAHHVRRCPQPPGGKLRARSARRAGGGAGAVLAADHRGARAQSQGGGARAARGADPLRRASSAQRRADRHFAVRRHRFLRHHRLRARGRRACRRTCAPSASSPPAPRSTRPRSSRWRRRRRAPSGTWCASSRPRSSPTSIG